MCWFLPLRQRVLRWGISAVSLVIFACSPVADEPVDDVVDVESDDAEFAPDTIENESDLTAQTPGLTYAPIAGSVSAPTCVINETVVRLRGVVTGENIPDGPITIWVSEQWSYRCERHTHPGDLVGEFQTTHGERFDFEVTTRHSGVHPPKLVLLGLLDLDGDDVCDLDEAMGYAEAMPGDDSDIILEMKAGECIGLM